MGDRTKELDAELSRGELEELPPNHPRGILGERGVDLYKVDTFEPDLNAGVSQEHDVPVVWMGIILCYLLVFTIPVAYWLLWRSKLFTKRAKVITTVVFTAGIFAAAAVLYAR